MRHRPERKEAFTVDRATALIALDLVQFLRKGPTASMSGVVHDTTGAVVPGVNVTARHTGTGLARTVETNGNGRYTMPLLPVREFELAAEKLGFRACPNAVSETF